MDHQSQPCGALTPRRIAASLSGKKGLPLGQNEEKERKGEKRREKEKREKNVIENP